MSKAKPPSLRRPSAPKTKSVEKTRPKRVPQPLEALYIDDALLEPETVEALTGLRRSARNEAISQGAFPEPVRLSATCVRWQAKAIREWLRQKAEGLAKEGLTPAENADLELLDLAAKAAVPESGVLTLDQARRIYVSSESRIDLASVAKVFESALGAVETSGKPTAKYGGER